MNLLWFEHDQEVICYTLLQSAPNVLFAVAFVYTGLFCSVFPFSFFLYLYPEIQNFKNNDNPQKCNKLTAFDYGMWRIGFVEPDPCYRIGMFDSLFNAPFFFKCFWLYRFEYPQPTFQKLMKEQCMEPFFVFQVDSILSKEFCVYFIISLPSLSFSPNPHHLIYFERHLLFLTWLYLFCLPPGFLCGTMVFGWVLVLQPVYSVYAVHVWVNNGKKSVKDLKWVKTCQSGYSDLNGAPLWKVCHFYYLDYFSFFCWPLWFLTCKRDGVT